MFAAWPSPPRRAASFVVQTASVVGSTSHVQGLLKGILNCDDRRDECWPKQRNARWHSEGDQGMVDRSCARHLSSPWGVRQRLTAWQLTGRLSNARNILSLRRRSMMKVEKMHIPPTALGPASGLSAVLGRDALGRPGDCIQTRRGLSDTESAKSQELKSMTRNAIDHSSPEVTNSRSH